MKDKRATSKTTQENARGVHKKRTRIRLGLASRVVLGVIAVGGVVTVAALFPGLAVLLQPHRRRVKYDQKQYMKRSVDSLLEHKLIRYTTDAKGRPALELTRKGRWEAVIRGISERTDTSPDKWDGKWRVIIFDVPIHKNAIRNELRRAASLRGFHQLQKSVWVYPYPCDDFVQLVKSHLNISGEVLYLQVSYLENDKWLKEHFNL